MFAKHARGCEKLRIGFRKSSAGIADVIRVARPTPSTFPVNLLSSEARNAITEGAGPGQQSSKVLALGNHCTTFEWGHDHKRTGSFQCGVLAPLAGGAVVGRDADAMMLVTACSKRDGDSLVNSELQVEYRSKAAAAGLIPKHLLRRELAPKEADMIAGDRIRRAFQPILSESSDGVTQLVCTMLSYDGFGDTPMLASNAASLALCMNKNVSINTPVAGVRVGGKLSEPIEQLQVFPLGADSEDFSAGDLDFELVIHGTSENNILSLDFTSKSSVGVSKLVETISFGAKHLQEVLKTQKSFLESLRDGNITTSGTEEMLGSSTKQLPDLIDLNSLLSFAEEQLSCCEYTEGCFKKLKAQLVEKILLSQHPQSPKPDGEPRSAQTDEDTLQKSKKIVPIDVRQQAEGLARKILRDAWKKSILLSSVRMDRRSISQLRPMQCNADILKSPHGSAVFASGISSSLAVLTLGSTAEALRLTPHCRPSSEQLFFVHFDYPPYAKATTGKMGVSRSMVTRGDQIRRALLPAFPSVEEFPYSVRVVCEATADDGAISTTSINAASVAMKAVGMPLKEFVGAASIGVVLGPERSDNSSFRKVSILRDLDTMEEKFVDAVLRVSGNETGFTMVEMDTNCGPNGIDVESLCKSLEESVEAKQQVIHCMSRELEYHSMNCSNFDMSSGKFFLPSHVPQVATILLREGQAAKIIGAGGCKLRSLEEEHGVVIDVEDTWMSLFAKDRSSLDSAKQAITKLFWMPAVGDVYDRCEVIRHSSNSAVVLFSNENLEATLHVSELDIKRVDNIEFGAPIGSCLKLKVIHVSDEGRIRMSRRAVIMDEFSSLLGAQA